MRKFSYITTSLVLLLVCWVSVGSFCVRDINKITTEIFHEENSETEANCLHDLIPSSFGSNGTASRKNVLNNFIHLEENDFENKVALKFRLNFDLTYQFHRTLHSYSSIVVISDNFLKQISISAYYLLFCTWRI